MVDHSCSGRDRRFLLHLVDLIDDGIEAAMAFDGVPIGISDGLPEPRRFCLARSRVSGCPSVENALGVVEMLLVPSDRNYVDSPTGLAELVPKLPVDLAPGMEQASGGNARVDVGEDGPVTLDGDWHLDVEIPDAAHWRGLRRCVSGVAWGRCRAA